MGRERLEDIVYLCSWWVFGWKESCLRCLLRKSLDGRMGLFGGRGKAELSRIACGKCLGGKRELFGVFLRKSLDGRMDLFGGGGKDSRVKNCLRKMLGG